MADCYLAVRSRRLSVLLSVMHLPVEVLEHVLVALLGVHYFLQRTENRSQSQRLSRGA